jgi:conjugal transfer pilus assembly protein TraF
MMKPLILLLTLALPIVAGAASPDQWFERHTEGWFWYIDPPVEEEETEELIEEAQAPQATTVPSVFNPKAELEAFQEKLENAQALAIMRPTHENVMSYLYLQKQAMDNSQRFSEMWQRVVWLTPELDHTQVRPTSPKAVHAYYDTRNANRKVTLEQIAQQHGLFYFFRESCPYCQRFSPILKSFAQRYGFHVTAISLDGGTSPGFPNPRADNGTAQRLGVTTVPAVYLVQPNTRSVQPVSFGLLGPSELEQRVLTLMNTDPGETL